MARNRRPPKRDLFGAIAHLGAGVEHVAHTAGRKAALDKHVASHVRHHRTGGKQLITPMQLSPAEERYVHIETQKRLKGPRGKQIASGIGRYNTAPTGALGPLGSRSFDYTPPNVTASTPALRKYMRTHSTVPQFGEPGFTGNTPAQRKYWRRENAINRRNQAELEAIVNPFSGHNVRRAGDVAWEMTGIPTLSHPIRSGLLADVLALPVIPGIGKLGGLGRIGKLGEELGKAGEEGALTGRAARRAKKALVRGPRRTPEAARLHVEETNARHAALMDVARSEGKMGGPKDILKPGEITPETGGVPGAIVREALHPNLKRGGKYERVGAKLDDPALLRKEQEALRAPFRSGQVARAERAGEGKDGLDWLKATTAALEGKHPSVEFRGLNRLTPELRDEAINFIRDHPRMRFHERRRAGWALNDALEGKVPTVGEQRLLERAFGKEVPDSIIEAAKQRGFGQTMNDLLGIPRALRSAIDFSAPGRQAFPVLFYKPGLYGKNYVPGLKGMFSEGRYQARDAAIGDLPTAASAEWSGLAHTDIGKNAKGVEDIYQREEAMPSNLAEQIPGVGHLVRGSDRGYVGFLNPIRAQLFDRMLHHAAELGYHLTDDAVKDIARTVNTLTGRGDIKHLQKIQPTLNALFFSPRLLQSRINLLNPYWYYKLHPYARAEALKSTRNFLGTIGALLFGIKYGLGGDVSFDPRSADFGKIRKGDTRIDLGAGFNQLIHLYGQFATLERKSTTTGKVTHLGGGFGQDSVFDVGLQFLENKANPIAGAAITAAKQDQFGQPVDYSLNPLHTNSLISNLWEPMSPQDALATAQETGSPLAGAGAGLLAATGIGVQSYPTPKKDAPDKIKSATDEALKELRKQENKLDVPDNYRHIYELGVKVKVQRDLAKDQARYMSPSGKISAIQSYRITMRTLMQNGMMSMAQYRAAIKAVGKMTPREREHWEYEAWNQLGPGALLEKFHSYYNEQTGK